MAGTKATVDHPRPEAQIVDSGHEGSIENIDYPDFYRTAFIAVGASLGLFLVSLLPRLNVPLLTSSRPGDWIGYCKLRKSSPRIHYPRIHQLKFDL